MVQTLATVMMCHKIKPSMGDCLMVSEALHAKFKFLGDESSEVSNDYCTLENFRRF